MTAQADITNHQQIRELLKPLTEKAKPLWGNMTARQMVEHLVEQVSFTNGALSCDCIFPPDEALKRKTRAKEVDAPMPRNVKFAELSETYEFPDLQSAIDQLIIELEDFDKYFETEGAQANHGAFGLLNHAEWI